MLAVLQSPTYGALRRILLYLKESVTTFTPMDVYIPYCLKEKRVWEEVYNCVTLFTLTSYLKVCFDFMHFRKFSWQQDSGDQT